MGKMKPSKENQIEFVASEIVKELERWEYLRKYGGCDPFWPDGVNMNLIRNHIVSYKRQLEELCETDVLPDEYYLSIPPEVDNQYLAKNGQYFSVRKKRVEEYGDKITTTMSKFTKRSQQELFSGGLCE